MAPKTIQSTVAFTDPQNNVTASGILVLDLSQPAMVTSGGGEIAPVRVAITLTTGGVIPNNTLLWANDQLSPSGTTYHSRLLNSNLDQIADFGEWNIAGGSPIDVSQIIPSSSSGGATAPSVVLQQPAAAQVINAQPLTMEGTFLGFSGAGVTSPDVSLSRTAAGSVAVGTGSQGSSTGTLVTTTVQQCSSNFAILDNLGVSHFSISAVSPFVNTFIGGNGSGVVFLGSASKVWVPDAGGVLAFGTTSGTADTGLSRDSAGVIDVGTGAVGDKTGTINATIINALTGFRVNGAATSANVLRGNGTNFVSAALAAADLSNGVTGTGAVVLAVGPTMTGTAQVGELQINTGVAHGGAGFQHVRQNYSLTVTTGTFDGANLTVNWPGTFADANYTVTCNVNNTNIPQFVGGTGTRATTSVPVAIAKLNDGGSNTSITGNIECIGVHD